MASDDLVTIYKLSDPYKAELIKATLLDHGLACSLDGERQGGFTGVFDIGILVRKEDEKKAREIIDFHHLDKPQE